MSTLGKIPFNYTGKQSLELQTLKCVVDSNIPGTPVFTHFTSARQRYALVTQTDKNENWIERVTEMDI